MASSPAPKSERELLRIGAAAEQAGVTCRTLRYYEELGLLRPMYSVGGTRRYSLQDVNRLRRIRELKELLGFDLGEIGDILESEDQLAGLRDEFRAGVGEDRHRQIVAEAVQINDHMRSIVRAKQERLATMMKELESKAVLYRTRSRELSSSRSVKRLSGGRRAERASDRAPTSLDAPHQTARRPRPPR